MNINHAKRQISKPALMRQIKPIGLALLSATLLSIGIGIVGVDEIVKNLALFPVWALFGVTLVFTLNLVVVAFRFRVALMLLGINLPFNVIFSANIRGNLASLFFIPLLAQVVGRQSTLRHYGLNSVVIASLSAIERALIFVVSGGFCLVGISWLLGDDKLTTYAGLIPVGQVVMAASFSLVLSLYFNRKNFDIGFLGLAKLRHGTLGLLKLTLNTVLAQGLVLGAFVIGALAICPEASLLDLVAAAAITSFAASLPISLNGWGVREVTAIYVFGYAGLPPSAALAVSILAGLCSTAVVLAVFPYSRIKHQDGVERRSIVTRHFVSQARSPVEQISTWVLTTACVILVFFQVHMPFQGGVMNINLSDPLAVMGLAALGAHCIFSRTLPKWQIPKFNLLLATVGLMIILAFLNGMQTIGLTQWAFGGRLLGWLVLLGYLSIGVLARSYLGRRGVESLVITLVTTAIVITVLQATMRCLAQSAIISHELITPNFEGYSSNRNSFAFQLLLCISLVIGLAMDFLGNQKTNPQIRTQRKIWAEISLGLLIVGIFLSGSRAGIVTCVVLLIAAIKLKFINLRESINTIAISIGVWIAFVWLLPMATRLMVAILTGVAPNTVGDVLVQSTMSHSESNTERWETLLRGVEMWMEHPLLGAGLGVFFESSRAWFEQPTVIHSTPLWVLAEFGLVGALLFFFGLVWIFKWIYKTGFEYWEFRALFLMLLTFTVFGQAHEIFYQRVFWLTLGLCMAMSFQKLKLDAKVDRL